MPRSAFKSAKQLAKRIDEYFNYIMGEFHLEKKSLKKPENEADTLQKVWDREPEPPTIAALALFLGFNSRQAFERYEQKGKFAHTLKSGHLRIEAAYEKKLHHQSSAGAIFALKNMGWNEKIIGKIADENEFSSIKIEIVETRHKLASSEKDVIL
jgi:hypothetical protein